MTVNRYFRTLLGVSTIALASSFSSYSWAKPKTNNSAARGSNETIPLPEASVEEFVTAIGVIKHYYIKDVKDKTLFENAIRGMMLKLDPHSSYLGEEALKELTESSSGHFGGIGIEIMPESGALKVISPLDDSPAAKAGVKPGDLIIQVGDKLVEEMTMSQAVDLIRGKPGTKVSITVLRGKENDIKKYDIPRQIVKVESVKSKMLSPGYGYLRISTFSESVKKNLYKAISDLKKQAKKDKKPLEGVVLDLRNNPGGLLNVAIDVVDTFVSKKDVKAYKGVVVSTKGRAEGTKMVFKAKPMRRLNGLPMVVLINKGSASASEIVAGALKEYKRAVIMGERSFGKGSVQTILPITKHSALKLTTSLYYTPSGREIQAHGIRPDVLIPSVELKANEDKDKDLISYRESALRGHIDIKVSKKKQKTEKEAIHLETKNAYDLAHEDYQLYSALSMLRGMSVMH